MTSRVAWGDEDDDDYLPPRQESGVDAKGIKTVVEWAFNGQGQKTKTTTKVGNVLMLLAQQWCRYHCLCACWCSRRCFCCCVRR
jgi:hypothetical protein